MTKLTYKIGDRYGNRTIIDTAEPIVDNNGNKITAVLVECDCGRVDIVPLDALKRGKRNQCVDCARQSKRKDGISKQPWYKAWQGIIQRCTNSKNPRYKDYGGRGIVVCDEWLNSRNFGKWAEEHGFQKGLQIDRINNDGNYEPSNCQFVTPQENMRNKRDTVVGIIGNTSYPMRTWCEMYNIDYEVMRSYKRRKNLSWEDAFFLALGRKTCKEYNS